MHVERTVIEKKDLVDLWDQPTQVEMLPRKGKDDLLFVLPENPFLYHLPTGEF